MHCIVRTLKLQPRLQRCDGVDVCGSNEEKPASLEFSAVIFGVPARILRVLRQSILTEQSSVNVRKIQAPLFVVKWMNTSTRVHGALVPSIVYW